MVFPKKQFKQQATCSSVYKTPHSNNKYIKRKGTLCLVVNGHYLQDEGMRTMLEAHFFMSIARKMLRCYSGCML
jgi:hypothetical protein